jgi:hypothetical protein
MSGGRRVSPEEIEAAILARLGVLRAGKAMDPAEVARALGGDRPEQWGPLMQAVRRGAVRLMKEGRVAILRKGRPVDPDDFRGIYRIALPADDAAQRGPGSSSGT